MCLRFCFDEIQCERWNRGGNGSIFTKKVLSLEYSNAEHKEVFVRTGMKCLAEKYFKLRRFEIFIHDRK